MLRYLFKDQSFVTGILQVLGGLFIAIYGQKPGRFMFMKPKQCMWVGIILMLFGAMILFIPD